MARPRQTDILNRLADVGEEAFSRVASSQKASRVLESVTGLRERTDELQRRLRGLDNLEKRIAKLEKTVAGLTKPKATRSSGASATAARKSPSKSSPSGTTARKKSSS